MATATGAVAIRYVGGPLDGQLTTIPARELGGERYCLHDPRIEAPLRAPTAGVVVARKARYAYRRAPDGGHEYHHRPD